MKTNNFLFIIFILFFLILNISTQLTTTSSRPTFMSTVTSSSEESTTNSGSDSNVESTANVQTKDTENTDERQLIPGLPGLLPGIPPLPPILIGENPEDKKDLWKDLIEPLYIDRTFNSSFALNVPLFTITIPGYGRGLKMQTALAALNVGKVRS